MEVTLASQSKEFTSVDSEVSMPKRDEDKREETRSVAAGLRLNMVDGQDSDAPPQKLNLELPRSQGRCTQTAEQGTPGLQASISVLPYAETPVPQISAVAINEDNNDQSLFRDLEKGRTNLCYASPECLLRNNDFKKLFRSEKFRKRLLAVRT